MNEKVKTLDNISNGFFRIRLVKGGTFVPAIIFQACPAMPCEWDIEPDEWFSPLDRSRPLQALVNGQDSDVEKVWIFGQPISQEEYEFMLADSEWCAEFTPNDPKANPYKAVDFTAIPELF